jgi:hypothetical protein
VQRRKPLPHALLGRPFSTKTALAHGATPKQLRAADLVIPFRGARLHRGEESLRQRCLALQAVIAPGSHISHSSAARLYGVPLPRRLELDALIHVSVPSPARPPQRAGVVGHSHSAAPRGTDSHTASHRSIDHDPGPSLDSRGLRISRPVRLWLELASQLDLVDLVIAGDYLLRGFREPGGRRRPFITLDLMRAAAAYHPVRRHRALVAQALELVRERVDSPYETRLRLIVQSSGFPDPIVNLPILDVRGDTIAQPDLRIPGFPLGLEYQGDGHRTNRSQWQRDVVRRRELDEIEWRSLEVVTPDIRNPGQRLRTLERELRQRGWKGTPTWPTMGIEY